MVEPRVSIEYCTKCRWNLRATWYLQELLATFGTDLGEVALIPGKVSGVFKVDIVHEGKTTRLWDRTVDGGFPDSKDLKQRVRDVIAPGRDLGHVDRHKKVATEVEAGPACPDC